MDLGKPKNSVDVESPPSRDRRRFLARTGAAGATVMVGGLAGCTSLTGGGGGVDTLNVAFKPVFPFLQRHVMEHEGYFDELDPAVEQTNFADKGLTIVSAYADGDIDLAFMGITPVIKMKHKGVPGKVTAANHQNGFVVLVHEEFAGLWADHGPEAFRKFREQEGRKFRFSTFPKGSVAFVVLQYWLREEVDVSRDLVEIETLGGAGPVRQSLLSGNADGTFIMEPIPTALQAKDAPFEWLTYTGEFMSGQPGGVMFMHDRLWEDDPDLARAIVERHVRATGVINDEPDTAARAVSETLGDKLPLKIARQAVRSKASNYISAPGKIESGTQLFVDEMRSLGQIEEAVDNDTIFEPSLYDEVST